MHLFNDLCQNISKTGKRMSQADVIISDLLLGSVTLILVYYGIKKVVNSKVIKALRNFTKSNRLD